MHLTADEEKMLAGENGYAAQKSMQILTGLGDIYGADSLIPVSSVQVAGVSYHNLGDAGLEFLEKLSPSGKVSVMTMLNPAGMDLKDWKKMKIEKAFADKQNAVIDAYRKLGVRITCTCTPYLVGFKPELGEHVAWSESSAVAYANTVLGARTNREGGPSALAAAIVGKTPNYGLHLDEERVPEVFVGVKVLVKNTPDYGALGYCIGKIVGNKVTLIKGVKNQTSDRLKSFGASVVTYGGSPLQHMVGVTPEAEKHEMPKEKVEIGEKEFKEAFDFMKDEGTDLDFVSLGCPHASIEELELIAKKLKNKHVRIETWIVTSRPVKMLADQKGYTKMIEDSGALLLCDTCMVVAPIKGRFKTVGTTSAKACFYVRGKNKMRTRIGTIEQCLKSAVKGEWVL